MTQPPVMQRPDEPEGRRPRFATRVLRAVLWFGLSLAVISLLLLGAAVVSSGRAVQLPLWAVSELQWRLNAAAGPQARISLDGVSLRLTEELQPELRIEDLRLGLRGRGGHAVLPEAAVVFDRSALLRGQLRPLSMQLTGARLGLRRLKDGSFDLDVGGGGVSPPASFAELLDQMAAGFNLPMTESLQSVRADAVTLTLDDRRAGRVWTVGDGRLVLRRDQSRIVLDVGMGLVGGGESQARAALTFVMRESGGGAALAVRVDDMAAGDLAAQAPALAPLGLLTSTLSGDLRGGINRNGITFLNGKLLIGRGALQPLPGVAPVALEGAELEFELDPAAGRLHVARASVESQALQVQGTGHVDLIGLAGGVPEAFVAQLAFSDIVVNPQDMFAESLRFSQGATDVRLRLNPFSVEIGQFSLQEQDRHFQLTGRAAARPEGWEVAVDVVQNQMRHDQLLGLWPVQLVSRTREWLAVNVQQGLLFDVKAGLRIRPGQEPRFSMGYEFADADVRFMPTLPPIRNGRGYAVIDGFSYITVVEDGVVIPPEGGEIRVERSFFRVPDFTERPARAEISLSTESSVTAALSLLDQPPFGFMSRAGVRTDLAEGRARLQTDVTLPLMLKLPREQIDYSVQGELLELLSERLVPGRQLQADRLQLSANRAEVSVSGPVKLGSARADMRWTMPLNVPGAPSKVTGTAVLDRALAAEFLSALGPDVVSGRGSADFEVTLARGAPPQLSLRSDLRGVGLTIPQLGWSKASAASGRLQLEGRLSQPLQFDRLQLVAPGLTAEGTIRLAAGGGLDRLALSRIKLGDWLDGQAELTGQGAGRPPQIRLTGGSFDLRRLPAQFSQGGGGGGGAATPIALTLDEARITAGIGLNRLRGQITAGGGGVEGQLTGLLNGQTPVSLRLVRGPKGTSVRLQAADGGAALRAAGLFGKARGGGLEVVMVPGSGRGDYRGSVSMSRFAVQDLPALAELLNALSIVGLFDAPGSGGVSFDQAGGNFYLTPQGIELSEFHAVGASFGVSLEGVYYTQSDRLNLRGVISPFYLINGIGSVLTRPGEGVVGITYRIEGSARAPQVSVNPLSALAPGFLRDLLRRPAATLP